MTSRDPSSRSRSCRRRWHRTHDHSPEQERAPSAVHLLKRSPWHPNWKTMGCKVHRGSEGGGFSTTVPSHATSTLLNTQYQPKAKKCIHVCVITAPPVTHQPPYLYRLLPCCGPRNRGHTQRNQHHAGCTRITSHTRLCLGNRKPAVVRPFSQTIFEESLPEDQITGTNKTA